MCEHVVHDYVRGSVICADTGEILGTIYDYGPEYRVFEPEDYLEKSRAGGRVVSWFPDSNIASEVGSSEDARFRRLKSVNRKTRFGYRERALLSALSVVQNTSGALNLPRAVFEEAATIVRKALDKDLLTARTAKVVGAAAVVIACRLHRVPRAIRTIEQTTEIPAREILSMCKLLAKELDLRYLPLKPHEFVTQVASKIGLSEKTIHLAIKLAKCAEEKGVANGRRPLSITAASLYIAVLLTGEDVPMYKIADATGVVGATVRIVYRKMLKKLGSEPCALLEDEKAAIANLLNQLREAERQRRRISRSD